MTSTSAILVVAAILLISTVIPGIRLFWPQRRDPVSRTDLGVALMTGALIAFAVLVLQILVEFRARKDAEARAAEAMNEMSNPCFCSAVKAPLRYRPAPTKYSPRRT